MNAHFFSAMNWLLLFGIGLVVLRAMNSAWEGSKSKTKQITVSCVGLYSFFSAAMHVKFVFLIIEDIVIKK